MGCVASKKTIAVSPDTHIFVGSKSTGYVAKLKSNAISDCKIVKATQNLTSLNKSFFFGLEIDFQQIIFKQELGRGNFGSVHEASYMGETIAVKKIFLPEGPQSAVDFTVMDFEKEVAILLTLKHPNTVRLLGAVMTAPNYCLLTELCAGSVKDLLQLARKKKILVTYSLLLNIAIDCANACAYIHSLDPIILHRDLKAENLLITKDFKCKISDFGLSRILEINDTAETLCGTPRWLAPEVYRGEEYTEKVDVYSFGICLWELFCFTKPYIDKDPINLPFLVANDAQLVGVYIHGTFVVYKLHSGLPQKHPVDGEPSVREAFANSIQFLVLANEKLRPPLSSHIPPDVQRLMKVCWDDSPSLRPSFQKVAKQLENIKESEILSTVIHPTVPYLKANKLSSTREATSS